MRGPASLLPDFSAKYVPSERDCIIFHEVCVRGRDPVRVGREHQLAATTVRTIAHRAQRALATRQYELRLKVTEEMRLDWLRLEDMFNDAKQGWERSCDEKQEKEIVEDHAGQQKKRVRTVTQVGQVGFLRAAERFMLHKRDLAARIEEAERAELAALKQTDWPQGKQSAGAVLEIVENKSRLNTLRAQYAAPMSLTEWEQDTQREIGWMQLIAEFEEFIARLNTRGGDPFCTPVPGSEMAEVRARMEATETVVEAWHAAAVAAGRAEADAEGPPPPGEMTAAARRLLAAFVPRDAAEARLLSSLVSNRLIIESWTAWATRMDQRKKEREAAKAAKRAEWERADAEQAADAETTEQPTQPVEAAPLASDPSPQAEPPAASASDTSAVERRLMAETETGTTAPVPESPAALTSEHVPPTPLAEQGASL